MSRPNTGKSSEAAFEASYSERGAYVYRFEDYAQVNAGRQTRQRIVANKPSDYHITQRGLSFFAEVKSTTKPTFSFSGIQKGQWIAATEVTAAGGDYYFFIHFLTSNRWYRVPARVILKHPNKSIKESELTLYSWQDIDAA